MLKPCNIPNYKCQIFGCQMNIIPNFVFTLNNYLLLGFIFSLIYGDHYVGSKKTLNWMKLGATIPVSGIIYELDISLLCHSSSSVTLQLFSSVCYVTSANAKKLKTSLLFFYAGQPFTKHLFLLCFVCLFLYFCLFETRFLLVALVPIL